jgi:biotin carboxyl carrier protein
MPSERQDLLRRALAEARERGMERVQIRVDGVKFGAVLGEAPDEEPAFEPGPREPRKALAESPVVGWFRPLDPPLECGQKVEQGDLLGHVFALEFLNDVAAPISGRIRAVLAEAESAVDYGRPLFEVEEDSE